MSRHPEKLPLLHGLVDGELDAANAARIETHLRECGDCRAELARIEDLHGKLAAPGLRDLAPETLRARIDAALDVDAAQQRSRPARTQTFPAASRHIGGGVAAHVLSARWASGALAGAMAAVLVIAVATPALMRPALEDELVQGHVRSLLADHVVDVATSNRHVVKPWFNGKIDFAPPVPELADAGFPLEGGRLDYIDDRTVAAIVYRRRLHTINLFVRPTRTPAPISASTSKHAGYTVVRWTADGLEYWAVSDLGTRELQLFRQLYKSRAGS